MYVIPGWLDHLLFLVLAVLVPLSSSRLGFRRLSAVADTDVPHARIVLYRNTLGLLWALAAALAVLWLLHRRPWSDLGLVPRLTGGLGGVMLGLAIVVGVMARQRRLALGDTQALERLRRDVGRLERMLPVTPGEYAWFSGLSVTAGICEETLYRGFLIWYLGTWAASLVPPPYVFVAAAAASSLVFGLGHAYQGPRNVLVTALTGGFLAVIYWITGSIFAGMLVHALMDLYAGHTSYAAHAAARAAVDAPGAEAGD